MSRTVDGSCGCCSTIRVRRKPTRRRSRSTRFKGGGTPKRLYVTFFAPRGNRIPTVGESAIWIAHRRQLWRLAQSAQYGTPYDIGLALDSDDDIRPVGEWPWLRAVAQKLQLSHVW